jgi:hypothetical protein
MLGQIHTYKSVVKAWITTFDISTSDDWYGVLRLGTTYSNQAITIIYCLGVVFLLNYMIWGLVMAVLLDAFSKQLEKEDESQDDQQKISEQVGLYS